MKTVLLNNILSEKELFFMYHKIISSPCWKLDGTSSSQSGFNYGPVLTVKDVDKIPEHYPFYLWGQTVVFRIAEVLKQNNVGIPTSLERIWFNCTYNGKTTQHWLHVDHENTKWKSILLFITPVWQPEWRGSFFVDGEEFKFKPGSAVVFDSSEYHQGESPESETYNWQRITCNILIKET